MKIACIITAGGAGTRFGGSIPKQYMPLENIPIIRRSAEVFCRHSKIYAVQAVIHPEHKIWYDKAVTGLEKLLPPVMGGAERQDSVLAGLEALAASSPDFVLIHDAARPFISEVVIDRVIAALMGEKKAVIPVVPVRDTLKKRLPDGTVQTVDRSVLWAAQTPQGFDYREILALHKQYKGQYHTDDAALFEKEGKAIAFVDGETANYKITFPEDLA